MLSKRDLPQAYGHLQTERKVNGNHKEPGLAILISDKIVFQTNNVIRDKEGYYIVIKGSTKEEYITIINIYALNI